VHEVERECVSISEGPEINAITWRRRCKAGTIGHRLKKKAMSRGIYLGLEGCTGVFRGNTGLFQRPWWARLMVDEVVSKLTKTPPQQGALARTDAWLYVEVLTAQQVRTCPSLRARNLEH
jgi:hypothetical protein